MQLTLEIATGPMKGRKLWLGSGQSLSIGRTERADFVVPDDRRMSSLHLMLACDESSARVRDLQSTNGTFVNGQPIREAILNDGDQMVAGQTRFEVHVQRPEPHPQVALEHLLDRGPEARQTAPAGAQEAAHPPPAGAATEAVVLELVNQTPYPAAIFPWENARGEGRLTVIVKATFAAGSGGDVQRAVLQQPILMADQMEEDDAGGLVRFESDMVPFKPRGDIVLVGHAHAPRGRPVSQLDVQLRVGMREKTIRVFGDRKWQFPTRLALLPRITAPAPFTRMELTYRRAFGGIDADAALYCKENLAGVGFIGDLTPKSIHNKPLPNLEDPHNLIRSWNSRPAPVGFGFYGRGWMPRLKYAGTYDQRYQQERAPLPPEDFSYEFYNGAHPDLQVPGFLRGDEDVELENLTPAGSLRFQLPALRPRVAITRMAEDPPDGRTAGRGTLPPTPASGPALCEEQPVAALLDTLVLVPDQQMFYQVFRVVFGLRDLQNPDIAHIKITL